MKKFLFMLVVLFSSVCLADEWVEFDGEQYYYDSSVDVLYYVGPIASNKGLYTPASQAGGMSKGGDAGVTLAPLPPLPAKPKLPEKPPNINTAAYWQWYWYWFAFLVDENEPEWIPLEPHEFIPVGFDVMPF